MDMIIHKNDIYKYIKISKPKIKETYLTFRYKSVFRKSGTVQADKLPEYITFTQNILQFFN